MTIPSPIRQPGEDAEQSQDAHGDAQTRPLPGFLASRYQGWHATTYAENQSWFRRLAEEGQRPRVMAIACCDSRVNINEVFSAQPGDIFMHRNIASLVPPYAPDGDPHGTSAAVEYAVRMLRVAHILVIGHSDCGGVKGCHDMCCGESEELSKSTSFIGRWLEILRPGYERVKAINAGPERLRALEKEAVVTSLGNLWTFPFVRSAVEEGSLSLHGLWFDIGEGLLESYLPDHGFRPV